jgi:gamma-glutamylcyclotransferase (GGCT)/AIG2-like uncharacterized protein YtfP
MTKLFVYGTLLPGQGRAEQLDGALRLGPALLDGAELFDLDSFPGICPGQGQVVGEVYGVGRGFLSRLDNLEGYKQENPEESLFVRRQASVRLLADGGRLDVEAYFYGRVTRSRLIRHGDYRRYRLEMKEGRLGVAAYGSNLDPERMRDRVGEVPEAKVGFIENFKLVFNKKSLDSTRANIRFSPGARAPAVVYLLNNEQILKLDTCEKEPDHYLRVAMVFGSEVEKGPLVQGYIANPDRLTWESPPLKAYLKYIRKGYRHWGFDEGLLPG